MVDQKTSLKDEMGIEPSISSKIYFHNLKFRLQFDDWSSGSGGILKLLGRQRKDKIEQDQKG